MSVSLSQFARDPLPHHLLMNATQTLELIGAVLSEMPELRFSSGYRSAKHNAQVWWRSRFKAHPSPCCGLRDSKRTIPQALLERFKRIATPRGYNAYVHDVGSGLHLHSEYRGSNLARSANSVMNFSIAGQASTDSTMLIALGALMFLALIER